MMTLLASILRIKFHFSYEIVKWSKNLYLFYEEIKKKLFAFHKVMEIVAKSKKLL